MNYKQNSQFGGHCGRHLEFQYEESTSRLGTQAKKFAHCMIVNIQLSNLFSGGGGTNYFFALLASALGHFAFVSTYDKPFLKSMFHSDFVYTGKVRCFSLNDCEE